MSWLRDHFHHFVFPAFIAAEKQTNQIGSPVNIKASPYAPEKLPSELQKLWTLCKEHGTPWSMDVREKTEFESKYGSSFRETAKVHNRLICDTLKSAIVAMRAEKSKRLLLAGRDVWSLAVHSERLGIPYIFIPEISRRVSESSYVRELLDHYGVTGEELLLDTGFAGSVPRGLSAQTGKKFRFRLMSQDSQGSQSSGFSFLTGQKYNQENLPEQLFPSRKTARQEALETEYLAKYWKTGGIHQDERKLWENRVPILIGKNPPTSGIFQHFSTRENIQRAAVLTSKLWRGLDWV